jgi:predicted PhzF superfamily epimerase YddE/YHI9
MEIPLYQVDAFTSEVFSGNPAAVCILDSWLEDKILQGIAAENNLSETAFLVRNDQGFDLRWFTPVTEVALCGHATLASAFVLFFCREWKDDVIRFRTRKSGGRGSRGSILVIRQQVIQSTGQAGHPKLQRLVGEISCSSQDPF